MLCLFAAALVCQQHPQLASDTLIYSPEKPISGQNFYLKRWGGGSFEESPWVVLYGKRSLRLTSTSYFQGGAIVFKKPLDLRTAYADKSKFLRFSFFLENPNTTYAQTTKNVIVKYKTRESYNYGQRIVPFKATPVTRLRLIFTTTDGLKSELYFPVAASKQATSHGWRTASIPFRAVTGMGRTNRQVREILLSMNSRGIAYLGDIDIATDAIPISVELHPVSTTVQVGAMVTFTAEGDAGLSPLKYQWDFDARDGVQVEAEAGSIQHRFSNPGLYAVTLTVADRFGVKTPIQRLIPVRVVQ